MKRDDRFDTLSPAFKLRINGSELPQDAAADVISLTVLDDADAMSMCLLTLKGWDGVAMKVKWMDDELFAEGNPIEVEMGYRDRTSLLFSGEIVGLEPEFAEGRPPTLALRCYDWRHRLARLRRTHTYLESKDSDIAARIAREAGMRADVEDSGVVLPYVLQHNQTDYEFLRQRAQRIGWEVLARARDLVFRPRRVDADATVVLRRESELLDFRPRLSTMGLAGSLELKGWSPQDKRELSARAGSGDEPALMAGSALGVSAAARAFPRNGSTVVDEPVHGQEEAGQLARAAARGMGLGYIRAEGLCIGEPLLRAGINVRVDGLGRRFSGLYYVNSAEHRFDTRSGYRTRFNARRNAS
ncbi:MAG: phage late control D family protein [Aquabacterium sp.]|nr:MAG: phage late control D family protein [Aquabacterium sp.]